MEQERTQKIEEENEIPVIPSEGDLERVIAAGYGTVREIRENVTNYSELDGAFKFSVSAGNLERFIENSQHSFGGLKGRRKVRFLYINMTWCEIDDEIADTVKRLNATGVETDFCCSGHPTERGIKSSKLMNIYITALRNKISEFVFGKTKEFIDDSDFMQANRDKIIKRRGPNALMRGFEPCIVETKYKPGRTSVLIRLYYTATTRDWALKTFNWAMNKAMDIFSKR